MGGQTISNSETRIEAAKLQSSSYGVTLAIAYGLTRLAGNLLWYGGFRAIAHTTSQGGKGGGVKVQNTTYTYRAAVAMGITETPVLDIPRIWRGKGLKSGGYSPTQLHPEVETYTVPEGGGTYTVVHVATIDPAGVTSISYPGGWQGRQVALRVEKIQTTPGTLVFGAELSGYEVRIGYRRISGAQPQTAMQELGLSLFRGELGQSTWSLLTSDYPDEAVPYSGIAYVAGGDYDLGTGAQVENHQFEVIAPFAYSLGNTVPDANPGDFLPDALCNTRYGASFPESALYVEDWARYCRAAGLLMSPAITERMSASEFVLKACELTNSIPVWSGSSLKIVPRGDREITGNGVTWTPTLTPLYDLTEDDFLPMADGEAIHITRGSPADAYNQVSVQFLNRDRQYNIESVEAKDRASITAKGLRPAKAVRADWICDADVARTVAQLLLQRLTHVRNTYEFRLPWTKALVEPGDLLRVTEAQHVPSGRIVRVVEVEEDDDGEILVTAEDCPIGIGSAPRYASQAGLGYSADYNAAPGSIVTPTLFEPPVDMAGATGLAVWCAVSGVSANWGGARVWVSLDGTQYKEMGRTYGGARYGQTTGSLGSGATGPVGVSLVGRGGQLLNATTAEADALTTLCMVDAGGGAVEYLAYESATLVATNAYNLGSLRRAAYGTGSGAKASGSKFVRIDQGVVKGEPLDVSYIGRTIYFKFTSFNVYGGAEEDLADVTAHSYTVTGAMAQLRPGVAGKAVRLSASSLVVQVANSGTRTPATINLTAALQGLLSGTPTITVHSGTATLTGTGLTRALATTSMLTDTVVVRAQLSDPVATYIDDVTITLVHEGVPGAAGATGGTGATGATGPAGAAGLNVATAYIFVRSASAPALPTASVTYTFAGGGMTGLDGGWSASVPAGTDPLYVSTAVASAAASTDSIAPGEWASPVVLAANGATGAGGATGATGATGAAGLSSAPVLIYRRTGTDTPPSQPSGTLTYTFATAALSGDLEGWSQGAPSGSGGYLWYTTASAVSAGASDTIATGEWATVVKLAQDGATGPAGAAGLNVATAYIFVRSASAPALPTASVTYTFAGGGMTGLDGGWSASVPAGTDPLYVSTAVASAAASTDSIAPGEWATPVVLAANGATGAGGATGATGATGAAGLNSAPVLIYRRTGTDTPPAQPSGTLTYTFATAALSGDLESWSQGAPSGSGGYLWYTTASAVSSGASDTIATGEWATVVKLAQDGAPGSTGATGSTGSTGAPGADAVVPSLDSEAVIFPADAAGNVSSYAGNTTTMTVTLGGVNDSANWTFSRVNGPNVTSTLTGRTLALDSITAGQDASYVDISATRSGFATQTKRFSVTKAKQGSAGATGATGATGAAGSTGAAGQRGNVQFSRAISGSSWSDSEALAAVTGAGFAGPVLLDRVTLIGTSGYVQTRFWDGSAWQIASAQLDGNLFVDGTIAGSKFVANTIETQHLQVGAATALNYFTGVSGGDIVSVGASSLSTSPSTTATFSSTGAPVTLFLNLSINAQLFCSTALRYLLADPVLYIDGVAVIGGSAMGVAMPLTSPANAYRGRFALPMQYSATLSAGSHTVGLGLAALWYDASWVGQPTISGGIYDSTVHVQGTMFVLENKV